MLGVKIVSGCGCYLLECFENASFFEYVWKVDLGISGFGGGFICDVGVVLRLELCYSLEVLSLV